MKNYDDNGLEEIEQEIKAQFDAIELEPAEETLAAIRPRLKKKRNQSRLKTHGFMTRFVAVAASVLLIVGIGLTVWLTWPDSDTPPTYRYEDLDIELKPCAESAITERQGVYVPNLDILISPTYMAGEHKETLETVYFKIEGFHADSDAGRKITLTIILQKKYEVHKEEQYNADEKITVSHQEISVFEDEYDPPFYNYKLGFKKGDVRYYIEYQTTSSENSDIESFMQLFLS